MQTSGGSAMGNVHIVSQTRKSFYVYGGLINAMANGTWRFNAALTRALQ